MRIATLINSHALSSTLSWFKFWWESMRGLARLTGHVSWELHESRRELQKQAISKSLPIRRRRKKENIITYHRQVTVGVMTRTVSSLTRSGEATSKNKEIEKRRKTLVNSHATLTARLTEQWELRKHSCKLSPANSHRLSSSFDPGLIKKNSQCLFARCEFFLIRCKHTQRAANQFLLECVW